VHARLRGSSGKQPKMLLPATWLLQQVSTQQQQQQQQQGL
jgi:hypothetical protein